MMNHFLSPEEWIDKALKAVLFVVLFALAYAALGTRRHRAPHFRWLFTLVNALMLTIFTVGCSANYPLLLSTQASLFEVIHRFRSELHWHQPIDGILGTTQLLLVDVSHDAALVADSSVTATWQGRQLITDRRKLTKLLTMLGRNSVGRYVHTVVCDLTFGSASDTVRQDTELRQALAVLQRQGKLLLAQTDLDENKEINGQSAVNADAYSGGSVDITTYYEGQLFAYQLFSDSANRYRPSLPFALYARQNGLTTPPVVKKWYGFAERKPGRATTWISGRFVPEFWFDDADVGYAVELPPATSWWPVAPVVSDSSLLSETTGRLRPSLYYLGQLTNDDLGVALFRQQLQANRTPDTRSVVFIGLFEGSERDRHQTLAGPMHGSLILLNVFVNLLAGSHHISLLYILYLFAGFSIVGLLMLYKTHFRVPEPAMYHHNYETWWHILGRMRKRTWHESLTFLVEQRAYLVALLMLIGAITFFNHLINIVVIELYLGLVSQLLDELYFTKPEHSPVG